MRELDLHPETRELMTCLLSARLTWALTYHERLRRVQALIQRHYTEEIDLTRAASVACLEPSSFSRFFSQTTGQSFLQWLTRYRVARALEIMACEQELPTHQVAEQVGLSVRNLQRAFRRHLEASPSEVSERLRQSIEH